MERRTKLALVILAGLLLLALGLYLLLQPYLATRSAVQQPPALPNTAQPFSLGGGGRPAGGSTATSTGATVPAPTPADNSQRVIENRARTVVERVGSGTSADGFLGYQDAMFSMTASGQASLQIEQQKMQQAHPSTGATYDISTHVVSSNLTQGKPGDATVVVTVQAVQTQTTASQPPKAVGKQIIVTLVKQVDGTYLVDSLVWSDVEL